MVVLVAGDANADLCVGLERFPREGDDARVRELDWSSGGTAVNVATALALLGAPVRLFARVGADPAADFALRAARDAGVDLGPVQREPGLPTGICFACISPGGERTFMSFRGANTALAPPAAMDDLLRGVAAVHVGGHALLEGAQRATALALIEEASRRGLPISLDLCMPLLRADPALVLALAPRTRVIFANELELIALADAPRRASSLNRDSAPPAQSGAIEAAVQAITQLGAPLVAAKLGQRGSVLIPPGQSVAPFPVEARDTTGSGDAYAAGFLFALLRGASPATAGRLGSALGALTATRVGAADALPSRAEVRAFLRERGAEEDLSALVADPPPPSA